MFTLSGTPDFTHSLDIHCKTFQSTDYVYGLMTLVCLPGVWEFCELLKSEDSRTLRQILELSSELAICYIVTKLIFAYIINVHVIITMMHCFVLQLKLKSYTKITIIWLFSMGLPNVINILVLSHAPLYGLVSNGCGV